MTDESTPPADQQRSTRSPKRIAAIIGIAVVAVIALGYGAIFFYANVLNDAPDELDESDLDAAVNATTTVDGAAPTDTAGADTAPVDTASADTEAPGVSSDPPAADTTPADTASGDPAPADGFDGDWVATSESEFGYRVEEVLAGVNTTAVGRSNEIDGTLTVAGTSVPAVDVEVQVATITSDKSQRDGAFAGRVMNSSEFPTATFTLTEPIELGAIPADGEQVTATATGDLTLRGVTNSVTFDVTAQATADRIGVLGSIPIVFSDYGIDNPSFGTVSTEDDGLLEFVLVFERA